MKLVAALLLVGSPLVVGCSADPTCEDVERLERQLEETSPEDPDFNDIQSDLNRAEADCNS